MHLKPLKPTSPSLLTVVQGVGSPSDVKSESHALGRVVTLATRLETSREKLARVERRLELANRRRSEALDAVNAAKSEVQANTRALREELC